MRNASLTVKKFDYSRRAKNPGPCDACDMDLANAANVQITISRRKRGKYETKKLGLCYADTKKLLKALVHIL